MRLLWNKIQGGLSYVRIIALGYLLVIMSGTLLLMLPFASKTGQSTDFLSCLFTATSSTCVTGLIVVDTFNHWTLFGQIVIIVMIQIGGLGFMSMGVLLAMFLKKRITLRTRTILQESMNTFQVGGIIRLVRMALIGTLMIEGTGAVILSFRFIPLFGWVKGIYYSVFHAVSAFCNAGFDLMGEYSGEYSSLTAFYGDPIVNIVVMSLIVIGGIGFFVWSDIKKCKWHFKQYMLHTKIVLFTTAVLLIGGTILFLIFERDNLFADMSMKEKILSAAFSAVTPRTAGFNTVDTAGLSHASKLLTVVLMFIGGSPGSTAGGIKTVTAMVLIVYVWSNLRDRKGTNIFKRRLEEDVVKKASNVVVISIVMAMGASLAICALQPAMLVEDVLLEVFSAIGTVGMSTGITRDMGTASRIILVLLMYCGRIGSMSFALSLTERRKAAPVQLPTEKIIIG